VKQPLDDPTSREFIDSCEPYSPESTDGRSAWWDLLEFVAVWGTALIFTIVIVAAVMWSLKIGYFG